MPEPRRARNVNKWHHAWKRDMLRAHNVLRVHNILYDRDDAGEFLHAYNDPFDDRFFFEIVQRVGDYQQYGAANASVRMAVQARRRGATPKTELLP